MSAAKAVNEYRMSTATICLSQAFFQENACLITIVLTLCNTRCRVQRMYKNHCLALGAGQVLGI